MLCDAGGHLGRKAAPTGCALLQFPSALCASACTAMVAVAKQLKLRKAVFDPAFICFPGRATLQTVRGNKRIKDISRGEKVRLLCCAPKF